MKNFFYYGCLTIGISLIASQALLPTNESIAKSNVEQKLKDFQAVATAATDLLVRASNETTALKGKRATLKSKIQQTSANYDTIVAEKERKVQGSRTALASALDQLYNTAKTDDEQTAAIAVRNETLEAADVVVNSAFNELKALKTKEAIPLTIAD
ncbi:MAG: hypothetical protein WCW33_03650 [Candidatus Babeliales bacterium]|jgi:hypothetical protein